MIRTSLFFIGLAMLALPALAASPSPHVLPKGSTPVSCSGSPFGKRLVLGLDQEVLLTRRELTAQSNNSPLQNYQFPSEIGTNTQRQLALSAFNTNFGVDTTRVDLDGDGRQEVATAVIRGAGVVDLTVVRPAAAAGLNEPTAVVSVPLRAGQTSTVTQIDLASGDLDGSRDGREELVLAIRYADGVVRILAYEGATTGGGALATAGPIGEFVLSPSQTTDTTQLVIALGDVLLEGRDQIVLLTVWRTTTYRYTVLRNRDRSQVGQPRLEFTPTQFEQLHGFGGEDPARLTLHIGDFGGSAAEELVVHHLAQDSGGVLGNIGQTVRYFTTTRNQPVPPAVVGTIQSFAIAPANATALRNVIVSSGNWFAAAAGEMDRRPDLEIVLARTLTSPQQVNLELFKVSYNGAGFPTGIGRVADSAVPTVPLVAAEPRQLELAVGDGDGDGIGDAYLAVRDALTSGGTRITKLRRFGLQRPADPDGFPAVNTFALRSSFDFPTTMSDTRQLQIDVADWNNDSVLANLEASSTCVEVREPLVRAVIRHPAHWTRLQVGGPFCCFDAGIGENATTGSGFSRRFDTFTSQDISGYVGVSVGGEILGIGAQATAKVTAGYSWEVGRGEVRTSEISTSVAQSMNSSANGGLVVREDNTHRCYEYAVRRGGVLANDSSVRACEVVRVDANNQQLRSILASDPVTWDTLSAARDPVTQRRPSQWVPLNPEWASLALFRRPTPHPIAAGQAQVGLLTDGNYGTIATIPVVVQPYFDLDLGTVRDVTNIRVFPDPAAPASLAGATVYLSETPFVGNGLPSGPGVRVFAPDADTDNGVDRWNIWTRSDTEPYAPTRARYLRIQHTATTARALAISELQVFGDVVSQPPSYPVQVCDPARGDGIFTALVYDAVSVPTAYRRIQMRGDLIWTSVPTTTACAPAPTNDARVRVLSIWSDLHVGGAGTQQPSWDVGNTEFNGMDDIRSLSHSVRVGAEVDIEAGAVVQAVVGGAYEWATGVTEEESTSTYWTAGINYRGAVPGFSGNPRCAYRTQPYSYARTERANVGYEHQFTVVDYVVPDVLFGTNEGFNRQTAPPPPECFPETGGGGPQPDLVFTHGFE